MKGVIFAELIQKDTSMDQDPGGRHLKECIIKLLDTAEAFAFKRITIGLGFESTSNPEVVCNLLYLGFQIVPLYRWPLGNVGLMLDFLTGFSAAPDAYASASLSDPSTSAECEGPFDSDISVECF